MSKVMQIHLTNEINASEQWSMSSCKKLSRDFMWSPRGCCQMSVYGLLKQVDLTPSFNWIVPPQELELRARGPSFKSPQKTSTCPHCIRFNELHHIFPNEFTCWSFCSLCLWLSSIVLRFSWKILLNSICLSSRWTRAILLSEIRASNCLIIHHNVTI